MRRLRHAGVGERRPLQQLVGGPLGQLRRDRVRQPEPGRDPRGEPHRPVGPGGQEARRAEPPGRPLDALLVHRGDRLDPVEQAEQHRRRRGVLVAGDDVDAEPARGPQRAELPRPGAEYQQRAYRYWAWRSPWRSAS